MRHILPCVLLAIQVTAGIAWAEEMPEEVGAWQALLRSGDPRKVVPAAYGLSGLGPDVEVSAAALLAGLEDRDSLVRRYSAAAIGELGLSRENFIAGLVKRLEDPSRQVRIHAALALSKLGPPAVPALSQAFQETTKPANPDRVEGGLGRVEERVGDYAALGLLHAGSDAVPALVRLLVTSAERIEEAPEQDTEEAGWQSLLLSEERKDAAYNRPSSLQLMISASHLLALLGEDAVDPLVAVLQQGSTKAQAAAIATLSALGSEAAAAVPDLVRIAASGDTKLREPAARALGSIGTREDLAVPALVRLASSSEDLALWNELETFGLAAAPELLSALGKADASRRGRIAHVLLLIGQSFEASADSSLGEVVGAAVARLDDPVDQVRESLLGFLAALGEVPEVHSAHAVVLRMLSEDPAPKVRVAAARFLGKVASEDPRTAPALVAALRDGEESVRMAAAFVLGSMGGLDPLVADIVRTFRMAEGQLRDQLLVLLAERSSPQALDVLESMLLSGRSEERQEALHALTRAYLEGASAGTTHLAARLQSRFPLQKAAVRADLLAALAMLARSSTDVLGLLARCAVEGEPQVKAAAVRVIGDLADEARDLLSGTIWYEGAPGPEELEAHLSLLHRSTSSALLEVLDKGGSGLRQDAALALANMRDSRAVPVLLEQLGGRERGFQLNVIETLDWMGPTAGAAAPKLRRLLQAWPDVEEAFGIAATLTRISPPDLETGVRYILDRADPETQGEAFTAALRLGEVVVGYLPRYLREGKTIQRRVAAALLAEFRMIPPAALEALQEARFDSDLELRQSAAEALVAADVSERFLNDPAVLSIHLDQWLEEYADAFFDDWIEAVRPPFIHLTSGRSDSLPPFPWPPPRFSTWDVLPRDLLGAQDINLGQVLSRLQRALKSNGYFEQSLFSVNQGFALMTQIERLNSDGTPYPGSYRWTASKIPQRSLDVMEYLSRLFLGQPGEYRFLAFLVTPEANLPRGGAVLSEVGARSLFDEGGRLLPKETAVLPFAGRHCHVLVYHFEKRPSRMRMLLQSALSAEQHLQKAGIWAALVALGTR